MSSKKCDCVGVNKHYKSNQHIMMAMGYVVLPLLLPLYAPNLACTRSILWTSYSSVILSAAWRHSGMPHSRSLWCRPLLRLDNQNL